ncbi:hypothetical protein ACJJTC_008306 [Scirpophaga incertulas]
MLIKGVNIFKIIEDCSDEELSDIELAIFPPDEVDEVIDIEEGPDDDMGVLPVSDVAGQVEFSCTINNAEEDHPTQIISRSSKTVNWRKCDPVYSEIQQESNSAITFRFIQESMLKSPIILAMA